MASERVPATNVTPVIENAPAPLAQSEDPHTPERSGPQSRERASDPFAGRRQGSPGQYASRNNSGNSSENHHHQQILLSPDARRISMVEKYEDEDNNLHGVPVLARHSSYGPAVPTPARYPTGEGRPRMARPRTGESGHVSYQPRSMLDYNGNYMIPSVEAKPANLAHRLAPTIKIAIEQRDKYALKAKWTGYALNAAIGLQVLLGSLTTGLSAAATSGRSAAVQTTILGGLSTVVASYLARSRGTNEPEKSNAKVKDLDHFIRECQAFELDHGHIVGTELDHILIEKRKQLEVLLGNTSSGSDVVQNSDSNKTAKISPV